MTAKRTLAEHSPALIRYWHSTKNLPIDPETVSYGSKFVAVWTCDFGHEYSSPVNTRTSKATGCPVCSNRLIVAGINDLPTLRPDLMKRWDSDLNLEVDPTTLSVSSRTLVWWTCDSDTRHRWHAMVQTLSRGGNCGVCHGVQVQPGVNDLASMFPTVAADWHPSLNGDLLPTEVTSSSHRRVWWKCAIDSRHEYDAMVYNRTGQNSGCPICNGKTVLSGVTDFATTHPQLLSEWDFQKNDSFSPQDFTAGSHKRAWWKCSKGHGWQASIKDRVRGRQCPFCVNKWIIAGENDLATLNPELVDEWDLDSNLPLTPTSVGPGSNRRIAWVCRVIPEHKWRASPTSRTSAKATGCPNCAKYGFSPSKPGILYFIENPGLRARKIGITNVDAKTDRIGSFAANGWQVVCLVQKVDGQVVADVELALFRWLRDELKIPVYLGKVDMLNMTGSTETFASDEGPTNEEIVRKIHEFMELFD